MATTNYGVPYFPFGKSFTPRTGVLFAQEGADLKNPRSDPLLAP